ncbi:MAG TPA: hypothetical protein PLM35_07760, partial [Cyclobacteriaceae bacterium]|nr:hypothetical protein [Cyclobacteriaceae bacterium]
YPGRWPSSFGLLRTLPILAAGQCRLHHRPPKGNELFGFLYFCACPRKNGQGRYRLWHKNKKY